jgi:DNA-binding beta-propeller fold protein YncE
MARNSRLVWGVILVSVFWVATVVPASARELWIVEEDSEEVQVFQSATDSLVGAPIPVGSEPRSIAFSPDGATAYVAEYGDHSVTPIDVATKTPGTAFDLAFAPDAIAVSPDGTRIFVVGRGGLAALDPSTGAILGKPWVLTRPAPPDPADLAVLPSGARAYTPMEQRDGSFAEFDLTSYSGIEAGTRTHFEGGSELLHAAAATPDGTQVLIGGDSNGLVDTATGKLTKVTTFGDGTSDVAINPDGRTAYAVGAREALWRYSLPSGILDASAISPGVFDSAVALNPAGDRLFVGESFPDHQLFFLDQASHARIGSPIALDGIPVRMATTPDQPPDAALEASADGGEPGVSISFDASGSQDPDGTIGRYDWNFGDGAVDLDAGPRVVHAYPKAGSFQATVTLTDDENCSTTLVYTGRSAYCAGGPVARATETIEVGKPEEPAAPGGPGPGAGAAVAAPATVTTPVAPAIPPTKKPAPKAPKCHKGFKKQKVHGKVRCVKAQRKRHRY